MNATDDPASPQSSDARLPDSWLSDLAILLAAALRRTPRRILACMALVFAMFLIAPFDYVIPLAVAFGAIGGTLETVRSERTRFPTLFAATLGFASLVAILTYDQITILRFDTDSGGWFEFINSSVRSELHKTVIGLPGRIATLSAVAVVAGVVVRLGPRIGRAAAVTLGVLATVASLTGIVIGFAGEQPLFGDRPWVHISALGISLILLTLAARPAGSRWSGVVAALAIASAVGFNYFSTLLIGIVAVTPLAGRTSAALVAGVSEANADAAAARLAARFGRRPLRSSAVAYLFVAATSWFLDWAALLTSLWMGYSDSDSDVLGRGFTALAVATPPIWQTGIVIAALGATHARGLATQLAVVSVWIVSPFVLGLAFFGLMTVTQGTPGGGPDPLNMMPMFYPFGLATLAGVVVSLHARPTVRRIVVWCSVALCLIAPWIAGHSMGAVGYLDSLINGKASLSITAASIPILFLTGALATTRRPGGTTLAVGVMVILFSLLFAFRPEGGEPLLFAHVLPEALAGGVAIIAIQIARRLHAVSPLPDDHAVFVLGKERLAAPGAAECTA